MRIIAGIYKGLRISEPLVETTRMSKERLREGVFSALQGMIKGSRVLDLFAGSGAYGFEALSRGAQEVFFVDNNKVAINALEKTKATLKAPANSIHLFFKEYPDVLKSLDGVFNLVFLDPPYALYSFDTILFELLAHDLIDENTIIVIEDLKHFQSDYYQIKSRRTYKYGLNHVTIIQGVNK